MRGGTSPRYRSGRAPTPEGPKGRTSILAVGIDRNSQARLMTGRSAHYQFNGSAKIIEGPAKLILAGLDRLERY
jgi:hypothetical protein